eukprot:410128-Pyramimonas_sp.AAC.1
MCGGRLQSARGPLPRFQGSWSRDSAPQWWTHSKKSPTALPSPFASGHPETWAPSATVQSVQDPDFPFAP